MACNVATIDPSFTPPESCRAQWTLTVDIGNSSTLLRQMTYFGPEDTDLGDLISVLTTSNDCLPPTSTGCPFAYNGNGCIAGYSAVAASTRRFGDGGADQVTYYCCPSEVRSTGSVVTDEEGLQGTQVCLGYRDGAVTFSGTTTTGTVTATYVTSGAERTFEVSEYEDILYIAPMLQIYQGLGDSNSSSSSGNVSAPFPPAAQDTGPRVGSLSVGAAVGLFVSIFVAVIAGAVILLWWLRRRHRRRAAAGGEGADGENDAGDNGWGKPELDSNEGARTELSGEEKARPELHGKEKERSELHGGHSAELGDGPHTAAKELGGRQFARELATKERPVELPA